MVQLRIAQDWGIAKTRAPDGRVTTPVSETEPDSVSPSSFFTRLPPTSSRVFSRGPDVETVMPLTSSGRSTAATLSASARIGKSLNPETSANSKSFGTAGLSNLPKTAAAQKSLAGPRVFAPFGRATAAMCAAWANAASKK